ncbi:MAG TPA: hypothetical protein VN239_08415 [Nitrososphaera sp.]|jgi:hypothetical protein|nr:hypothetical protein [Nitrososphaera sp.]
MAVEYVSDIAEIAMTEAIGEVTEKQEPTPEIIISYSLKESIYA